MANDKGLISFAILSTETAYGNDYFDMIIPFVLYALNDTKGAYPKSTPVRIDKIFSYLEEEFGLSLHKNVIDYILRRLSSEPYLNIEIQNNNFYLTGNKIDVSNFKTTRTEITLHQKKVLDSFFDFLRKNYTKIYNKYNKNQLTDGLIVYLSKYGIDVLNKESINLLNSFNDDFINFSVGDFIKHSKNDRELFSYIQEIVKGAMLVSAINVKGETSKIDYDEDFKKLSVFLDTPLLMYSLGYAGDELRDSTLEMVNVLNSLGVKIYYFQHNLDELNGILNAFINHYNNGTLDQSYNFEYFINSNITASMVVGYKARLQDNLKNKYNILLFKEKINRIKDLSEYDIDQFISEKMNYHNPDRRLKDATSIYNVLSLRKNNSSTNIEDCEYIFITTNMSLDYNIRYYSSKILLRNDFSLIIHDTLLSSILWLKVSKTSDNIPTLKIISDAVASQSLPQTFWDEFVNQVNELNKDDIITENELYRLKYDSLVGKHVYKLTVGDVGKINYENIREGKRIVRNEENKELVSELEKEQIRYQELLEKHIKNFYLRRFSKWKFVFYLSKYMIILIGIIFILISIFLNNINNTISLYIGLIGFFGILLEIIIKIIDLLLSYNIDFLKKFCIKKSFKILCEKIKQNDPKQYDEILNYFKTHTNYFNGL